MNIVFNSASQLAQMIREREVSAVEVLDAHLKQIEQYNGQINAIATLNREEAIPRAIEADEAIAKGENWGVLHGVPVTIKDLLATAELTSTAGYLPLKNYIPDKNATTVARLQTAGAIILGKTNTPQLGEDYQTKNSLFGQTNNPWDLDCTAGGSSGGSASAIAAGFSPLDLGSDIGGSIRLPAHYCGVYGFMPTDGRVSTEGHIPPLPGQARYVRQMLRIGPLARSIEDLQLCMSLIAGADNQQPDIPPVPLDKPANKQLSELKVAWTYGYDFLPISQDTRSCIQNLIDCLSNAGCQLSESHPSSLEWSRMLTDCGILSFFELFASTSALKDLIRGFQFALKNQFVAQTQTTYKSNNSFSRKNNLAFPPSLAKYKGILAERDRAMVRMDLFMDEWDAWITPVSLDAAFAHCNSGQPIEVDGVKIPYILACGGYTMPLNFTGSPVVVIPIGQSKSGLPIGVQIVGKRWQDLNILAIAKEIDRLASKFQQPSMLS